MIDRLKSMPMARSAVLAGRLVADTLRMFITILIIVGVGYLVGFRFQNGFGLAVAMVVLATVFGLAICCIAAYTGLAIGDEESVQAFGLIWLFPLTFVSSAFVPISTMPGWLQAFANTPAGHLRHRHHARDGAGRADRDEPVEEHRVAGRDLHRVRAARGPRLPPGRLSGLAGPATAGPAGLPSGPATAGPAGWLPGPAGWRGWPGAPTAGPDGGPRPRPDPGRSRRAAAGKGLPAIWY